MNFENINLNPLCSNRLHLLSKETEILAAEYLTGKYRSRLKMSSFLFNNFDISCEETDDKAIKTV